MSYLCRLSLYGRFSFIFCPSARTIQQKQPEQFLNLLKVSRGYFIILDFNPVKILHFSNPHFGHLHSTRVPLVLMIYTIISVTQGVYLL